LKGLSLAKGFFNIEKLFSTETNDFDIFEWDDIDLKRSFRDSLAVGVTSLK